jgi:hypothetical protein
MGKAAKGKPPSPKMRRAQETNDAVERILADTNESMMHFRGIYGARENVLRVRRGQGAVWPQATKEVLRPQDLVTLMDHVARCAVVDLWRQQGRIAYDLHPEMASTLYRADLKGKLPGRLFKQIPHISPMIPLPRPWPYRSVLPGGGKGREGLIRAYFLTGRVGQGFCPTTDKRAEGLVVMPWIEWTETSPKEYGRAVTPLFALPSTDDPFTLDDVIDQTNAWHSDGEADHSPTALERRTLKQLMPGFLSIMTYLCCDNRDVEEPRAPQTQGKRKQAPPRDPFYVRVGWHVGPALHAARVRAQQGRTRDGVSVPSGVEYGPQHRTAHFKTVHHGPGRSLSSARFIEPYWTKRELLEQMLAEGKEPGTGIIPVNQQQRDPSNHRDIKLSNLGRTKAEEIKARQRAREEEWDW